MRRLGILGVATVLACSSAPPKADEHAAAAPEAADVTAARAAWDAAARLHLAGDDLAWRVALAELAAKYPKTRHGRHALTTLGSSGALALWAGLATIVTIPAFVQAERGASADEGWNVLSTLHLALTADGAPRARSAGPLPAKPGPDLQSVSVEAWKKAGFPVPTELPTSTRFSYQLEADAKGFTARATSDLDGDGVVGTYVRCASKDAAGHWEGCPMDYQSERPGE